MALVARELSVVITPTDGSGAVTIGGASTMYLLDGKVRVNKSYPRGTFEFDVVLYTPSPFDDLTFSNNLAALETLVRKKHARIQLLAFDRVTLASRTLLDVNPTPGASGNTGFNAFGEVDKPGSLEDNGRSRRYRMRYEFDLPADLATFSGRRDSDVEVVYSPSRKRRLTISGTYTALATLNSTAQYQSAIATYASTIYTALGGTWNVNRALERFKRDDQDKILDFTVVYDELIFSEVSGASIFDDPRLTNPTFNVEKVKTAPGDTFDLGPVVRLATLVGTYEAWVDATLSKDLAGIYAQAIRPWIIQNAAAFATSGAMALIGEDPGLDPVNNRISARLTFVSAGDSKILSRSVTTIDDLDLGKILTAVWTGDPWNKVKDQGPMSGTRTVTATQRVSGAVGTNEGPGHDGGGGGKNQFGIFGIFGKDAAGLGVSFVEGKGGGGKAPTEDGVPNGAGDPFKGLTKELMHQTWSATPLTLGAPGDPSLDVTDQVETTIYAFYKPLAGPTTTGGGNKTITLGGTGQSQPGDPAGGS